MPIYMTEHGALIKIQLKPEPTYTEERELFVFSRKLQDWKPITMQPNTSMGKFGEKSYLIKSKKYPLLDTIRIPTDDPYGHIDTHHDRNKGPRICFVDLKHLGLSPDFLGDVSEDNLYQIKMLMSDENLAKRAEAAKAVRQLTNHLQIEASAHRLEQSMAELAQSRMPQAVNNHVLESLEQVHEAVIAVAAGATVSDRLDGKLQGLLDLAQKESDRVNSFFKRGGRAKAQAINAAIDRIKVRATTIPDGAREQSYVQLARECGLYKALKSHRYAKSVSSTKKSRALIAAETLVPELAYKL